MEDEYAEHRRYRRIFIPGEMVVIGVVAPQDTHDDEFPVKVLNISEGGLFFTIIRELGAHFRVEDTVVIKWMAGPAPFTFSRELLMKIRWAFDQDGMSCVGYGCEFINPSPERVLELRGIIGAFEENSVI